MTAQSWLDTGVDTAAGKKQCCGSSFAEGVPGSRDRCASGRMGANDTGMATVSCGSVAQARDAPPIGCLDDLA